MIIPITVHMHAMCSSGSYEMNVATWRPAGTRLVDRMKRFFVGGPPEVDDISYVACPKDFNVRNCVILHNLAKVEQCRIHVGHTLESIWV